MSSRISVNGFQHQGGRSYQEDRFFTDARKINGQYIYILAVADGMGGHKAGDIAAELAINQVRLFSRLLSSTNLQEVKKLLEDLFDSANKRIKQYSGRNENTAGLGTTLIVAVVVNHSMIVAHIGDSRAYIVNESGIFKCTKDHSAHQEAIDAGIDLSRINVGSNALTRCLDGGEDFKPDISAIYNVEKSLTFLCSDGLYNTIEDNVLESIANEAKGAKDFVSHAVKYAVKRDANDNVTVVALADGKRRIFRKGMFGKRAAKKRALLSSLVLTMMLIIAFGAIGYGASYFFSLERTDYNLNVNELFEENSMPYENGRSSSEVDNTGSGGIVDATGDGFETVDEEREVVFHVEPHNAQVIVANNSEEKIEVPRNGVLHLREGSYTYEASLDGFVTVTRTFNVLFNETNSVSINLEKHIPEEGTIQIRVLPEDANVTMFNTELSKTFNLPSSGEHPLPPGKYEYTVEADGFETIQKTLQLGEAEKETIDEVLEKIPNDQRIEEKLNDEIINTDIKYSVILFNGEHDNASGLKNRLREIDTVETFISIIPYQEKFRLIAGPYNTRSEADEVRNRLEEKIDSELLLDLCGQEETCFWILKKNY